MCTVSIVPLRTGFRLVCNRDERLTRAVAEQPRARHFAQLAAMWPTDPVSGGTWIGANDHGVAAAVLNRNPEGLAAACPERAQRVERACPERAAPCSRGTIIPGLLAAGDLHAFVAQASGLSPDDYEPYVLLAVQRDALAVMTSTGSRIALSLGELSRPVVFTSSSLGDALVDAPRRALFARMVEGSEVPLEAQARYHRHRWPDRPAMSVLMSRPGAATVSRTIIDVTERAVSMRYEPIKEEDGGQRAEDGQKDGNQCLTLLL